MEESPKKPKPLSELTSLADIIDWQTDVVLWLQSSEAKKRRKAIKESSAQLSKSLMDSLKVDDELLHSKITI